jgi:hypothetical protein
MEPFPLSQRSWHASQMSWLAHFLHLYL